MRTNLTKAFVKRAKCQNGKTKEEYYDKELTGFILEVRSSGAKSFNLRTTVNKKRISRKVGDAKVMDIEVARIKALKLKRALEEQKDILLGKSAKSENKASTLTLGSFYEAYYLPHIKKHIKSYATNISVFKNHILPKFAKTPMNMIKKQDVMQLHCDMVQKKHLAKATANKVLIFLSSAYNVALEYEVEGVSQNPTKGIKEYKLNNQRQRYLTKEEAQRLLDAINQTEQNIHLKYIVPMLILTGARKGEVLRARYEDFNLNQLTWTIPISKSGKKRILPITPQLLELYNSIPKTNGEYLFASPVTGKPYVSIYNSWNSARTKAGLKDVRMHDLRHSFASALVNSGRSLYEVQTLLGHSTSTMTQRYAHLSNESLMNAASCASLLLG